MRTPSPLNAVRPHAPSASLSRMDAGPHDTFYSIDFSAPAPGEQPYPNFSEVGRDIELGVGRPAPAMPPQQLSYMPPSVALMLLEPQRATFAAPTPSSAGLSPKPSHGLTACLILLGVLAGASVGCAIYFGVIRAHTH